MNEEFVQEVADNTQDYIETINQLKANTVSREDYDRVVKENKQLITSLANGKAIEPTAEPKKPLGELIAEFKANADNCTNLDYIATSLELREAMLEAGLEDPFTPHGKQIAATSEDMAVAERVAEGLQHCVDYAKGDPQLFTAELQRITRDTVPMVGRKR